MPASHGRQTNGVVARVVEQIFGRAIIAAARVHTMQAQRHLPIAHLHIATATHAARIGVVTKVHRAAHFATLIAVGQRRIIHQHDSTHRTKAVANALGTFHHFHHARTCIIQLGRMVGTPALALQTHTIINEQNATAMHTLNHRLGNSVARADGTHAGNALQHLGQRVGATFLQRLSINRSRLLQHIGVAFLRRHHHVVEHLGILLQQQRQRLSIANRHRAHHALISHRRHLDFRLPHALFETQRATPIAIGSRARERPIALHRRPHNRLVRAGRLNNKCHLRVVIASSNMHHKAMRTAQHNPNP